MCLVWKSCNHGLTSPFSLATLIWSPDVAHLFVAQGLIFFSTLKIKILVIKWS